MPVTAKLSRKFYEKFGFTSFAGPFAVAAWIPGFGMTLSAFPLYVGGAPSLGRIEVRFYADRGALVDALRRGEVDVAGAPAVEADLTRTLDRFADGPLLQALYKAANAVEMLRFGTNGTVFTDLRVRHAVELALDRRALVETIKRELGPEYPVICRMNGRDLVPGGLELDEAVEIGALLEAAGADSLSVSGGIHASRPYAIIPGMSVPRGCYVAYSEAFKRRLTVPIMTVGRINTPALAEEILAWGRADLICLSRALLADPHFPAKARSGRVDHIVPCIACNECIATVHRHKGIACTMNPMVSRELEFRRLLATRVTVKRVAVVGGGVAGMAAAITAAERGHTVHLFEADRVLGGHLRLAHLPPHREELENALRFFEREVERSAINVHLDHPFTVADAQDLRPDTIILATGAESRNPDIPGVDLPHVVTGWRIIAGLAQTGANCVVIGGGLVGMEAADYLAERGKRVVIVARSELLKKAVHADRVYFLDRLRELGIEVLTYTKVHEISPGAVTVEPPNGWRRALLDVDTVVLCTGYAPRTALATELADLGIPVHLVGDVQGSRKFFEAIEEGTLAAIAL